MKRISSHGRCAKACHTSAELLLAPRKAAVSGTASAMLVAASTASWSATRLEVSSLAHVMASLRHWCTPKRTAERMQIASPQLGSPPPVVSSPTPAHQQDVPCLCFRTASIKA